MCATAFEYVKNGNEPKVESDLCLTETRSLFTTRLSNIITSTTFVIQMFNSILLSSWIIKRRLSSLYSEIVSTCEKFQLVVGFRFEAACQSVSPILFDINFEPL